MSDLNGLGNADAWLEEAEQRGGGLEVAIATGRCMLNARKPSRLFFTEPRGYRRKNDLGSGGAALSQATTAGSG